MDDFAGSWKALIVLIGAGALLLVSSLSVEAHRLSAAAEANTTVATLPVEEPDGIPPPNDIADFPQLD